MPNFAIMRSKKLNTLGSVAASLRHAYRERETLNADPARTPENDAAGSTNEIMGKLRAALPEKRRKDAVVAVEYLMTASPEWWRDASLEQQRAFFDKAKGWLREKYGAENILTEIIHRDETSPHLSAFVVPLTRDGRLSAKSYIGNRAQMTKDQTTFAARVKDLGLERGIEGSKARHKTIQQHYADLNRPVQAIMITPEAVQPRVLEQRLLTQTVETPAMVAARLTKVVQDASAPLLARAQAAETARTRAEVGIDAATSLRGRLGTFYDAFLRGLRPEQQQELVGKVAEMRKANAGREQITRLEEEQQRRIDALPSLLKRAGAVLVFARRAIEAIKAKAGNWRVVDWEVVQNQTMYEAVHEHHQPRHEATEAVLRHSPRHADKTEQQIRSTVARIKERSASENGRRDPTSSVPR